MNTTPTPPRRRTRMLAALGGAAALALTLAACGSGGDSGGDSGAKADGGASSGSGDSQLAAQVKKLTQPLKEYPVPDEKVKDVADAAGGTVYYIPISQQSPQFAVTEAGLKAAAKTVGMSVQVCDGKGTPTNVSACVSQATKGGASGIILDAVAYGIAANAIDSAQKADIPVVIANQMPDSDHPASKTFAMAGQSGTAMQEALAKWISLDSKGKATVLINQSTDGPSPAQFVAAGKKIFSADCPQCEIDINKVSSANFQLIPSSTSSALLKNPNVDYVASQFEQYLQATEQGVQHAGKTGKVSLVTGAAQLSGLKELAGGGALKAAVAQASAYQGWVELDAILRLKAGQDVPDYTIPVRLFTQDSVKDATLTAAAQASGEWFGPTTYTSDFETLWGVK